MKMDSPKPSCGMRKLHKSLENSEIEAKIFFPIRSSSFDNES
jgi:hypothetical protein